MKSNCQATAVTSRVLAALLSEKIVVTALRLKVQKAASQIVNSLADHPDVRSACRAAGIDDDQQGPYLHAFGVLVQSKMLIPVDQNSPEGSTAS